MMSHDRAAFIWAWTRNERNASYFVFSRYPPKKNNEKSSVGITITATHRAPGLHFMSSPMDENARRALQQALPGRAKQIRELLESFEVDRKKALSTDSPASRDVETQLQAEIELLHAARIEKKRWAIQIHGAQVFICNDSTSRAFII
jgi:hypothetical protein